MKLYDGGRAPNPRRVTIYLREKGIEVPLETVNMTALEHRDGVLTALNPLQRLPVLELGDGTVLTETIAICRYFEELHPTPPLFGTTPLAKAQVEMWQRRVEFGLLLQVANVFRHSHSAMAQWEVPQVSDFAEACRPKVMDFLAVMNSHLEGRDYLVGETFTVADVTALVGLDFMKPAKLVVPEEFTVLRDYHQRLRNRPGAAV